MDRLQQQRLKKSLGLPKDFKFKGYVLHLDDSDEFLATYQENEIFLRTGWTPFPEMAKVFKKPKHVLKILNERDKGGLICYLFENDVQCVIHPLLPEVK
ncbi:hypothetical protein [Motiliproteus sp. MSK22-1]|uniref:hypothetical protein n=1 Tax=Motiliproteus sp. MSK22-1 TaxID=1897630 RepID=UPI0009F8F86C|nr:hypothetical protein [Motiliproteus sp. MSK22-1]